MMGVNMKSIKYPLHADNIYLRILDKEDIERNAMWLNSEYISDIMGYLPTMSKSQQYEWYDKLKNDNNRFVFAICLKDNDQHIGNAGLGNIDYVSRHAMYSIFIADQQYQSKGNGSKSTRLILSFAFERLNLNKIYLQTSSRFSVAIKMYESIGFVKEGTMRQHYYSNGVYEDKIIYSILRSEYLDSK
jgi:RimJ/RimL family protein N-acetyltransferase